MGMVALVAAGWRKPARAAVDPVRARRDGFHTPVTVRHEPAQLVGATPWYRRLIAVGAGFFAAIVAGAVLATVVAFTLAQLVITLTHLLKR